MATVGLLILFGGITLIDIREVRRKKGKKEFFLYFSILFLAFTLSELHILGVKLIGLNHIIEMIIRGVGLNS